MTRAASSGSFSPLPICLVIPCFNEVDRLDLPRFRKFLASSSDTRLVFVDDGSHDQTLEMLSELCAGFEHTTHVLVGGSNHGKAEAVRSGILYCLDNFACQSIGFWDADLATPLEAVAQFEGILRERAQIEMVFGARVQLLGRNVHRKPARHYLGRVFATAVSAVLKLPIYDTQCGAKLFRVQPETRSLFAEPFLSKWVFDVEILARYQALFRRQGKNLAEAIYEYPLEVWVDVAGSKVGIKDFLVAIWDVMRIRQKYSH